jgi:multimeric flavodoxin WrbA
MEKVRILGVAGSPRKDGNTTKLVQKALEGAMTVSDVDTELYELAGKKIHHCLSCYKCMEKGQCIIEDDLQPFTERYMEADGIIWGAPVYHISIPASMKALFDRLGSMLSVHYFREGKDLPRFSKVCGVVTGGGHRYGGQELALSFMIGSSLLMNGVVVSGDTMLGSYIGAAACTSMGPSPIEKDNVLKDEEGLRCAASVGKRVAEMTWIVRSGISTLEKKLPGEYFQKFTLQK